MLIEERGALSVREAAKYTSLGITKLNQLIRNGEIESVKLGRRRLVKTASLRKLLGEDE